jgi:AbrB family looped-hinge helix DNA binding protein
MNTTIDKVGRLVIPQGLRSQVGLSEGGPVNIRVDGAAIVIEPVGGEDLEVEGDLLVIPATDVSVDDELVREMRLGDQR